MLTDFRIAAPHPYPWPKTLGFDSENARETIVKLLKENKVYSISEKLDGCNVCVSSDGYIASRKYVIATKRYSRNLQSLMCQGVSMLDGVTLMDKALHLKSLLAKQILKGIEFEVLLYGELMKKGTSRSHADIYNYEKKNIHPGKIYVFAMGLVLPQNTKLPFIFDHGFEVEGPTYPNVHIIPLNFYLSRLLSRVNIEHVPILATGPLCDLLCDERFNAMLLNRQVEGFVLSGTEGQHFIKWKYNTEPNSKLSTHLDNLMLECKDTPSEDAVAHLQQLCDAANMYITKVQDTCYSSFVQMYMEDNEEDVGYATEFLKQVKKGVAFGTLGLNLVLEKTADDIFHKLISSISMTNAIDPMVQVCAEFGIGFGVVFPFDEMLTFCSR